MAQAVAARGLGCCGGQRPRLLPARGHAARPRQCRWRLTAATATPLLEREAVHGDPWEDKKWAGLKWTVYRDVAYNLTPFFDAHPAGNSLLRLAVGRDCTALFESYHLRPEVAAARLRMLPVLADFPTAAVPRSPRPNDSQLYVAIRDRVRAEVFRGEEAKGVHRSGTAGAAATILGFAAAAWGAYAYAPSVGTGAVLGLAGAWIGLTVQHCGNHGAMSTSPLVNDLMGLTDDLIGGSSLMWRYHHQVSHHIHCNDAGLDEDVFSAFPLLRFDARLPRFWFHKYQHLYMWLLFPLMQLAFQVGDLKALFTRRTEGASLRGASLGELASVLGGKAAHFGLLLAVPAYFHGLGAVLPATAAYIAVQGVVLAATFAVSHNLAAIKRPADTAGEAWRRDWGAQQVVTSASWGGVVGNFMTGGLNLQIEHHLFPAIAFLHYPAIAAIVEDECAKRGVPYAKYGSLPEILVDFVGFMRDVGAAEVTAAPAAKNAALAF